MEILSIEYHILNFTFILKVFALKGQYDRITLEKMKMEWRDISFQYCCIIGKM